MMRAASVYLSAVGWQRKHDFMWRKRDTTEVESSLLRLLYPAPPPSGAEVHERLC